MPKMERNVKIVDLNVLLQLILEIFYQYVFHMNKQSHESNIYLVSHLSLFERVNHVISRFLCMCIRGLSNQFINYVVFR